MTIYRNGMAIELTDKELSEAYNEQQYRYNVEDIEHELEFFIFKGDLPKEAKMNSELISEAAEEMQFNIDKYGMNCKDARIDAITEIFLPYYESEFITFDELREKLREAEKRGEHITGIIVFTKDSFKKNYTAEERSYRVSSDNNAFKIGKISNSIYGDCLDGKDLGVRLDLYMYDGWKVEKCYIEKV